MKKSILIILITAISLITYGFNFSLRMDNNMNNIKSFQGFAFKVTHDFKGFNFLGELNAYNDNKYNLSGLENAFYEGYYFYMKNG
ncbi:hypothetical protein, partial [Marinitoga sp. 1155]|uniref:hypothetical protein n=1 Tax=Marinitoga sp. 1155 TaxID=1428448 RepID=UPI000640F785